MSNVIKWSALFIFLIITSHQAHTQIPELIDVNQNHFENKALCSHAQAYKNMADKMLANPVYFRPYDVLNYDIFLDWYNMMNMPMKPDSNGFGYLTEEDVVWSGRNTITLRIDTAELSTLEFDSKELKILSVKVNGEQITPTPPVTNNILSIPLNQPLYKNDTAIVTIDYKHDKWYGENQFHGFFLYPKRQYLGQIPVEPNDSSFIEERLAYTMSEPEEARYWVPCNDAPHDKASLSMTVRVPSGYSVASNGLLENLEKTDTVWTYFWRSDNVMAPYLMHAAASIFTEWSDWYHKVTNPQDSIEIKYFAWQKDFNATAKNGSQYNAHWAFEQNVEQIGTFAKLYGEYPYKKYGLVCLQQFYYGGMEHQTITSINRVWLRQNARWGLAHELSHQWLGDLITCKTWNDIWVNEGGATFSEAIWSEHVDGMNAYFDNMVGKRNYYLKRGGRNLPPIYGLPTNTIFGNYAVLVYQKASWIYHQLRMILGDDVFFPALRSFLNKNKFTSVDHNDFIKSFTEDVPNPPINFDTYFTQWLMKNGHPLLSLNVTTTFNGNEQYLAHITLAQTQKADSISDIFEIPVRIVFKDTSDNEFVDTLWQKQREISSEINLPFFPSKIYVDTSFTLCEVDTIITDVIESADHIYTELAVAPNPVRTSNIATVSFGITKAGTVNLELYNLLGLKQKQIFNGYLDKGSYKFDFNTNHLIPGVYILRARNGSISRTKKIIIY